MFCRLLREARATQNKSARDVAKATDLSTDNIYAIERGEVLSPGIYTVHLLAREYGLDLNELAASAQRDPQSETGKPHNSESRS